MKFTVAVASSEAVPFSKTGGLADVAGSLPAALKALGCDVALFIPYYTRMGDSGLKIEPAGFDITVPVGKRDITAPVYRSVHKGVDVYLLRCDEYFDRSHLYGTPDADYFDNLERFAFFSRGVLEALKALGAPPDIIHCNDWQTGLVPAYLRHIYNTDPFFSKTATLFTIHNMAYQGLFHSDLFELTGLPSSLYHPEGLEFWGKVNLLKAGLAYSDVLTTVSKGYAREIQTPEHGCGLDGFISMRKKDLHGVLNGVDYDEWDPSADPMIPCAYSEADLSGKAECRARLLERFGLQPPAGTPVVGMVSRLAGQKGFDILIEAMERLMALDMAMVIVGTGNKLYQSALKGFAARWPASLGVEIGFDTPLSHLVEAGSDIFLMPSHYEPCGLNQIYSLRYGTVPVVRATGGLDDTVRDYSRKDGNGFKFKEYSADALVAKMEEALAVFKDKKAWTALQRRGMLEHFSWEDSAASYVKLYATARKKCLKIKQSSTKKARRKKTAPSKSK